MQRSMQIGLGGIVLAGHARVDTQAQLKPMGLEHMWASAFLSVNITD